MIIPPESLVEDNEKLPEVSITMPRLNDADTLSTCIVNALQAFLEYKITARFSAQISCLSFQGFFVGAAGFNLLVAPFDWRPMSGTLP
jgi:hypothetical protein